MFCAPGLIFDGTEGAGSRFHVSRVGTSFRRYGGRCVPFSCFARQYAFLAVPRATGPVFMFCPPRQVFGRTEGVGSHFHVLRARTRLQRYRGCRVPFSCFALSDSFPAVPSVGPVFMFCLPNSFLAVPRASSPVFKFCVLGLIFGGTEGVWSRFQVLRSQTCLRRCRVHRVPVQCFVRPYSFSAVSRATGPIFMFCAPRHISGVMEGVGSRFDVLRSLTLFRRFRGRQVPFSYFALSDSFSAVRGHPDSISCFAPRDSFSALPRASGLVFMFCASGLIFYCTEGFGSRFIVLRTQTHFRRY
jgi:hypothetical protein